MPDLQPDHAVPVDRTDLTDLTDRTDRTAHGRAPDVAQARLRR